MAIIICAACPRANKSGKYRSTIALGDSAFIDQLFIDECVYVVVVVKKRKEHMWFLEAPRMHCR
jgi:hypothetical protein